MSTLTSQPPVAPAIERFKFTIDDYYRLAEVGILGPEDRVELIDGEIFRMSPIGRLHAGVLTFLAEHFYKLVPAVVVMTQNPVKLDEFNDPQPDVLLLRPRRDRYRGKKVTVEDVLLLIEVSDTTFRFDYDVKRPRYAKNGIPETWVIDLHRKCAHVCRRPAGETYQDEAVLRGNEMLTPLAFPDHRINVAEVIE